jgi:hypothetical protein
VKGLGHGRSDGLDAVVMSYNSPAWPRKGDSELTVLGEGMNLPTAAWGEPVEMGPHLSQGGSGAVQ